MDGSVGRGPGRGPRPPPRLAVTGQEAHAVAAARLLHHDWGRRCEDEAMDTAGQGPVYGTESDLPLLPVVQDEGEEEKEEADQVGGRMPIPTAALSSLSVLRALGPLRLDLTFGVWAAAGRGGEAACRAAGAGAEPQVQLQELRRAAVLRRLCQGKRGAWLMFGCRWRTSNGRRARTVDMR